MKDDEVLAAQQRVLVLAPTGRDAALVAPIFERAGIACFCCRDLAQLCAELERGAAAIVLAEEAVLESEHDCLVRWLAAQPPWSDLAVLLIARPGVESTVIKRAMELLGNVTVLERPTRVASLVSAVRAALRGRQRQYQIREHLAQRERDELLLRANDRRKDEFLAILAHELRNPLAPIRNALHILRLESAGDERIERVTDVMDRQVSHLVRLVDDLLEISRISRGKIELRKERVDVATVLRTAIEASRPLIDDAHHVLQTELPQDALTLDADPVRLAQVFANLLNNAAKYTPLGGSIWLSARPDGDFLCVSVRDNGAGIPAHMLPRIFDLFTQVNHGAGRAQGGLGIGLTLVKSLVEMHGGTVTAQSRGADQGSEFVVRLPLAHDAHTRELVPGETRRPERLARKRVLVVDDNRDSADTAALLLKVLGADVRVVYGGEEALNTLQKFRPDVVLLDIGMPGMDGHEVARRVRQRSEYRDVTLVALSGWGQREDVLRTRAAGCDYHLIKPLDLDVFEKLLATIDNGAGRRKLEPLQDN